MKGKIVNFMKFTAAALYSIGIIFVSGCASTNLTDREINVSESLPRPGKIVVYDFTPDFTATTDSGGQQLPAPTQEQIDTGKQLGMSIAAQLVQYIQEMGLPAESASQGTRLHVNDLVIKGTILSVVEGSGVKRVVIGFGSGGAELQTRVEGYQVTDNGLRKLGSGKIESGGSKSPGGVIGGATWIATSNPIGFVANTGVKAYEEASGKSTIDGRARSTAQKIAEIFKEKCQNQGWIE